MSVQDDKRENEIIKLFGLHQKDGRKRSDVDAYLVLDGREIPFELKSSTKLSVTTVRDFGLDHIEKWKDKHWLFGFYAKGGEQLIHCHYGSPSAMQSWIDKKIEYTLFDFNLAQVIPDLIDEEFLYKVCEEKEKYTLDDAKKIQKKQYSLKEYKEMSDIKEGKSSLYSPEVMLRLLKDRCKYLILRGSTLNNPHIPASYFKDWKKIETNHVETLKSMVKKYLDSLPKQSS